MFLRGLESIKGAKLATSCAKAIILKKLMTLQQDDLGPEYCTYYPDTYRKSQSNVASLTQPIISVPLCYYYLRVLNLAILLLSALII